MPNNEALFNLGNEIKDNLIASAHRYGRVASGGTINAIEVQAEGMTRVLVLGPERLIYLEKGRGPTHATGPYQRYGGLSFKESLAQWMAIKGIDQKKKANSSQQYGPVFWAIYTSINEKGFAGTPGLISKPLANEAINSAMDKHLGNLASIYVSEIFKLL